MSFWDFFRTKKKENTPVETSTGFVPLASSDTDTASASEAPSNGTTDMGSATSTNSGGGFFGGDDGGGGDGGGN